jgi:SAM-dependent methyltransferase
MAEKPLQSSIERAWQKVAAIEDAYARGDIDQKEWHERMAALVVPAYLAAGDERGQSGYSGTEADWRQARIMVADAMRRAGSFLDIGCANGLLMESVHTWCREKGIAIDPYGVDISEGLASLARKRLPQWSQRIFVGNAAEWIPPRRFDFVRLGLEYVPRPRRSGFLTHVLTHYLLPNGRLLVGPYSEERDETRTESGLEDQVRSWGFVVAEHDERPHRSDDRVVRHLLSIDALA